MWPGRYHPHDRYWYLFLLLHLLSFCLFLSPPPPPLSLVSLSLCLSLSRSLSLFLSSLSLSLSLSLSPSLLSLLLLLSPPFSLSFSLPPRCGARFQLSVQLNSEKVQLAAKQLLDELSRVRAIIVHNACPLIIGVTWVYINGAFMQWSHTVDRVTSRWQWFVRNIPVQESDTEERATLPVHFFSCLSQISDDLANMFTQAFWLFFPPTGQSKLSRTSLSRLCRASWSSVAERSTTGSHLSQITSSKSANLKKNSFFEFCRTLEERTFQKLVCLSKNIRTRRMQLWDPGSVGAKRIIIIWGFGWVDKAQCFRSARRISAAGSSQFSRVFFTTFGF